MEERDNFDEFTESSSHSEKSKSISEKSNSKSQSRSSKTKSHSLSLGSSQFLVDDDDYSSESNKNKNSSSKSDDDNNKTPQNEDDENAFVIDDEENFENTNNIDKFVIDDENADKNNKQEDENNRENINNTNEFVVPDDEEESIHENINALNEFIIPDKDNSNNKEEENNLENENNTNESVIPDEENNNNKEQEGKGENNPNGNNKNNEKEGEGFGQDATINSVRNSQKSLNKSDISERSIKENEGKKDDNDSEQDKTTENDFKNEEELIEDDFEDFETSTEISQIKNLASDSESKSKSQSKSKSSNQKNDDNTHNKEKNEETNLIFALKENENNNPDNSFDLNDEPIAFTISEEEKKQEFFHTENDNKESEFNEGVSNKGRFQNLLNGLSVLMKPGEIDKDKITDEIDDTTNEKNKSAKDNNNVDSNGKIVLKNRNANLSANSEKEEGKNDNIEEEKLNSTVKCFTPDQVEIKSQVDLENNEIFKEEDKPQTEIENVNNDNNNEKNKNIDEPINKTTEKPNIENEKNSGDKQINEAEKHVTVSTMNNLPKTENEHNDNLSSSLMQTEEINFGFDPSVSDTIPRMHKGKVDPIFSISVSNGSNEQVNANNTIPDNYNEESKNIQELNQSAPIRVSMMPTPNDIKRKESIKTTSRSQTSYNYRPKTAPFHVPPFDQKIFEKSLRKTQKVSPEIIQFKKTVLGFDSKKPKIKKMAIKQEDQTTLTRKEVVTLAEDLAKGKKKKVESPIVIADVIDELSDMKLETMQAGEYTKTVKIGNLINTLRRNYRLSDRENFHNGRMNDLGERINEAKQSLNQSKDNWKEKEKEMAELCDNEAKTMDKRHDYELKMLEEEYKDPKTLRKFNKKSPYLLNQLQMEKNMLLTGQYTQAIEARKYNKRYEKMETNEKFSGMVSDFETTRQKLLQVHANEIKDLKALQESRWQKFRKAMNKDINKFQQRVDNIQYLIDEEGDNENFCALKFKKPADIILPMTVTINGGTDIPTSGKTRAAMGDNGKMSKFRDTNNFPPLQLPPLKAKKVKNRPKAFSKPKPKKRDTF